jgi:hypothetical protein
MRPGILVLLFLTVTVCGSQPAARTAKKNGLARKQSVSLPIATITSSRAFAVNGVSTPPAVTSVDVASGDAVEIFYAPAIIKFTDGRSETLMPGATYRLPSEHGKPIVRTADAPGKFLPSAHLPPVSGRRP